MLSQLLETHTDRVSGYLCSVGSRSSCGGSWDIWMIANADGVCVEMVEGSFDRGTGVIIHVIGIPGRWCIQVILIR